VKTKKPTEAGLVAYYGKEGSAVVLDSLFKKSILRVRPNKIGSILAPIPYLANANFLQRVKLWHSRPVQNLSVSRKASLFCLYLKRRSKPTPRLSLKGVIGAGHRARWNDAESVQCTSHRLPLDCTLAPLVIETQPCYGVGSLYLKTTTSPLVISGE